MRRRPGTDRRTRGGRALSRGDPERLEAAARAGWAPDVGPQRRRRGSAAVRGRLARLWRTIDAGPDVALAAVGSLARDELGPCSDLDLVLVYDPARRRTIEAVADRLWYPLWDAGTALDHAVRTPAECEEVARADLTAAIGLLDLRHLAGDGTLTAAAREAVATSWRRRLPRLIPELCGRTEEREASFGVAAHLLEPDLKEARGGLRDVAVLRALATGWLVDPPHRGLAEHHQTVLDVRDALHLVTGRGGDRLTLAEVPAVAARLGLAEDALRARLSGSARYLGHALDAALRTARQSAPRRTPVVGHGPRGRAPQLERAAGGLIVHTSGDGYREVALGTGADPADPVVGLRAAALAAARHLPLSPVTAARLGRFTTAPTAPWPEAARSALLDLLSAGPGLLPVWEELDLAGCLTTWLPVWTRVRGLQQHNPLHRHTVDRHSVQTVIEATGLLQRVRRPDLLVLAALLHDIGKSPRDGADHAVVGAPVAGAVVARLGYPEGDVRVVERLVRHHLSLAELAIRHDPDSPETLARLLVAVDHDPQVLALLHGLTEADARAVGRAAWSRWRARLVAGLAARAERALSPPRGAGAARPTSTPAAADGPPGRHPW